MQWAGHHRTGHPSDWSARRSTPGLRCPIRRLRAGRAAWAPTGTNRVGDDPNGQSYASIAQPGIAHHAHLFRGISVAYDVSLAPAPGGPGRPGLSRAGETLAALAQYIGRI